jgi:hypothetical protein
MLLLLQKWRQFFECYLFLQLLQKLPMRHGWEKSLSQETENSISLRSQWYSGRKIIASFTDRYRHTRGRQERPKDDSTEGVKTESFPCIIRYETVRFRLQKYRNGWQLWAVNVFSYTIHAQTDCWPSPPLAPSIFLPLLLWRFLSSQLFCVHYIAIVPIRRSWTRNKHNAGWQNAFSFQYIVQSPIDILRMSVK